MTKAARSRMKSVERGKALKIHQRVSGIGY